MTDCTFKRFAPEVISSPPQEKDEHVTSLANTALHHAPIHTLLLTNAFKCPANRSAHC
jgi:hypothetical protein